MKYIDAEKLKTEIERRKNEYREFAQERGYSCLGNSARIKAVEDEEILSIITSLQNEQPKSRFIQVKCINPYDDSWEKDKIYTCEVWHHGDLNHNFWDVYYDYGKNPKYVQFPTFELLHDEFEVLKQEQTDVNLV